MEWSNPSLHLPSFLEYHLFDSELTSEIKFSPIRYKVSVIQGYMKPTKSINRSDDARIQLGRKVTMQCSISKRNILTNL